MKLSPSVLFGFAGVTAAFPAGLLEDIERASPEFVERASKLQARGNGDAPVYPGDYIFSQSQLVDVTGAHAFVPPGPNDIRGPCPGLNAFANHNYIPHNGIATVGQFTSACQNVVGMGFLLAGFLSVYGAIFDGDGQSWSIGGQIPGNPTGGDGISNSHNKYESDASPTRGDLYQDGEAYTVKTNQFQDMINTQPNKATANYNIPVLTDFRAKRFNQQVATNPYFFNGPFSGVLVQPAAYTFIYRFMANHSAADPVGFLNQDVLKSWFAISGDSGSYTAKQGWERIPANWYRRSLAQPYEVDYFMADVLYAAAKYPMFLSVGGNTGKPNSFTGVDVTDISGGVFSGANLLQGNNSACFAMQFAQQAEPDVVLSRATALTNAFSPLASYFQCGTAAKMDDSKLRALPGYSRAFTPAKL